MTCLHEIFVVDLFEIHLIFYVTRHKFATTKTLENGVLIGKVPDIWP